MDRRAQVDDRSVRLAYRWCSAVAIFLVPANTNIYRVEQLENKIGAGLIEEVIQVAEGELNLIDTMVQSKA